MRRPRSLLAVLWVLVLAIHRLAWARDLPDFETADATFARLRSRVHDTYFSNEELDAFVLGMAAACSDIMSVFEWGRSEGGTRLLGVDISSTAGERCGRKPRFLLVNAIAPCVCARCVPVRCTTQSGHASTAPLHSCKRAKRG